MTTPKPRELSEAEMQAEEEFYTLVCNGYAETCDLEHRRLVADLLDADAEDRKGKDDDEDDQRRGA